MSVHVIKAFVKMREMLLNNAKLAAQLREMEERMDTQEMNIVLLMDKLRKIEGELVRKLNTAKTEKIGFHSGK